MSSGCPSRRVAIRSSNRSLAVLAVALPLARSLVGFESTNPGAIAFDRDAEAAELVRDLPREADLPGLRARVRLDPGQAHAAARAGRDVDDAPVRHAPSSPGLPPGCTGTCSSGSRRRRRSSPRPVTSSSGCPTWPTTPPALLTRMSTAPTERMKPVHLLARPSRRRCPIAAVHARAVSSSAAAIAAPMP